MGHRREQLASVMHRAVQNILTRGLGDPRIRGMITVTQVEVSGDQRDATVHVSILPAEYQAATMAGLHAATIHLQKLVNEQISVRRPPHIRWRLDERIKKRAALLAAIEDAVDHSAEGGNESETGDAQRPAGAADDAAGLE